MYKKIERNVIKTATIICVVAIMSMSIFACKPNTNNVTSTNQTKVDVNSPEVQATLGKVRNYEAEKLLPSGTAEREKLVWTKRNHKWAEPPEEDKVYAKGDNKNEAWGSLYVYNGVEYWVTGSNKLEKRVIYKKVTNNWVDDANTMVMRVSHDVNDSYHQLIAELELGHDISKNMRGNTDTINITK